jgi:hypothetical protein
MVVVGQIGHARKAASSPGIAMASGASGQIDCPATIERHLSQIGPGKQQFGINCEDIALHVAPAAEEERRRQYQRRRRQGQP